MEALAATGANVFRNNFAHVTYDEYRERLAWLKEINAKLGTHVKMQADLQGPNIRLGEMPNGAVQLVEGETYYFYTAASPEHEEGELFIDDQTLHLDVQVGEPITFADGALEGEITEVNGHKIAVRMNNGGWLKSRKSINVPETKLSFSSLTEKDTADLAFLLETGVDIVCLSFICSRHEIDEVHELIGDRPIRIIAKIERREAIHNLHEIMEASDGIMIARGDLGIELPLEQLPVLQKQIINLCEYHNKPVIMATQMLLSMVRNMRPTRAEVSDVASAIYDRVDAVMLSEETAEGVDPVNALSTMVKIVREIEGYLYHRPNAFES
jgi:pyruvate kinase